MEESNVNLLSVKTHKVENNNMVEMHLLETIDFEKYDKNGTENVTFVKKRPCWIYVAAGVSVAAVLAVLGIILSFTVFKKESRPISLTTNSTFSSQVQIKSSELWASSVPSISFTSFISSISPSSSFLLTSSVPSISSTSVISSISPSSSFFIFTSSAPSVSSTSAISSSVPSISSTSVISSIGPSSSFLSTSCVSPMSSTSVVSSISPSSSFLLMSNIYVSATVQLTLTSSESLTLTPSTSISVFTKSSTISSVTESLFSTSFDILSTTFPNTTSELAVVSTVYVASSAVEISWTKTLTSSSLPFTSAIETISIATKCEKGQYQCIDGTCIKELDVCNGKPDCATAEDESINCSCLAAQYRCASGQCIAKENRCDSITQCNDRSDEINCTGCTGFQCDSGQCLWRNAARCDSVFQCLDLSDEKNCGRTGLYRCDNSVLIPNKDVCDGIDNCFDNSDEINCGIDFDECPIQKRMCNDKTCVLHDWWCDGYVDCPDRSDEMDCGTCSSKQFQCPDYSCIETSQICDGIKHCTLGTDEVNCVMLQLNGTSSRDNGVVMVKSVDKFLPVCSDVWYPSIANNICQLLGHKGISGAPLLVSVTTTGVSNLQGFMVLEAGSWNLMQNHTILSKFTQTFVTSTTDSLLPTSCNNIWIKYYYDFRLTCSSNMVVQVSCQMNVCGRRQVDLLIPMIVGGVYAPAGKWPWVVSLSMLGEDICGGVILSPEWILTAAHCIVTPTANYSLTPHFFTITAGSILRKSSNSSQMHHIARIVLHPNSTRLEIGVIDWDIALIQLSTRLKFGDYVQPSCLPSQNEEFPNESLCYLAGWGFINPKSVSVDILRETKMQLWGDVECAATTANVNSTLCAGYHSGLISACKGDSGGPLMCTNTWDHWTVVGIMSHGIDGCDGLQGGKPNRFAKVSATTDWIKSVISV